MQHCRSFDVYSVSTMRIMWRWVHSFLLHKEKMQCSVMCTISSLYRTDIYTYNLYTLCCNFPICWRWWNDDDIANRFIKSPCCCFTLLYPDKEFTQSTKKLQLVCIPLRWSWWREWYINFIMVTWLIEFGAGFELYVYICSTSVMKKNRWKEWKKMLEKQQQCNLNLYFFSPVQWWWWQSV